ncbi:cysteine-rich receptor-like protein kinase, partial [Trifolium medium]|nr:cysteine-rich receptor-like protein kinase [Trifolium medium]
MLSFLLVLLTYHKTVPFTATEIEEVVLSSDGDKSSGPDGFNFAFFKRFWGLLKCEVGVLFDQFFVTTDLPRSFSSYFITLIPKIISPLSIGDFRPISLVGTLYKIIVKVLATRLAKVMDKLISPNQSAFIKGTQFGFGGQWRSWIKACVFSGNLSVLVNDSPTERVKTRGSASPFTVSSGCRGSKWGYQKRGGAKYVYRVQS